MWRAAIWGLVMAAAGSPALACSVPAPLDPRDVRHAHVVVVGRIVDYRIVLDERVRAARRASSARSGAVLPESLEAPGSLLSDYARFDVEVDRVLAGKAPRRVSATWDNSTFAEPAAMPPGRHLVALRRPSPRQRATGAGKGDPKGLTVLQAPCAPAFIFPEGSAEAAAVRKSLRAASK